MNTRDKRASAIGIALAFRVLFPLPDGAVLDQGDRQQTAYSYRGIAATQIAVNVIEITGTYEPTVSITGTYTPTITISGEWE